MKFKFYLEILEDLKRRRILKNETLIALKGYFIFKNYYSGLTGLIIIVPLIRLKKNTRKNRVFQPIKLPLIVV
ncbi:MAG: hypothetical protein HPY60_10490 [Candidatus Methanofastidiosum sp.]|nr:hypothetical protein [Methanofastidiosum sp.]